MSIKKLHFISGITITVFVGLHLFNHAISIFGVDAHIELMDRLRVVYRNIFVESVLLLAVIIQIFSGVKLFFSKRKFIVNQYERLQIWTGLYLAFFLVMHVGAVLAGRYILDLDTNYYFGVAGLNAFPLNLFFIPYYSLAIFAFFGHISAIHYNKMKVEILGLSVGQQSNLILMVGIVLIIVILYGLTNGFAGVEIPDDYKMTTG